MHSDTKMLQNLCPMPWALQSSAAGRASDGEEVEKLSVGSTLNKGSTHMLYVWHCQDGGQRSGAISHLWVLPLPSPVPRRWLVCVVLQ